MKIVLSMTFLMILYFFYGFFINQYDLSVVPKMLKPDHPPGYYDYRGVTNIHTNFSIGSASPDFVFESARLAELDFVMLTDLNSFEAQVPENYYSNLVVLTAGKYSYLDSRFLRYSPQETSIGETLGEAQLKLADFLSQNKEQLSQELTILAHPFKLGYQWNGALPEGLDGIEIINLKALSVRAWEKSRLSVFWSLLIYPFNSRLALIRLFEDPKEELDLWDRELSEGNMSGFAGAEASARALPLPRYSVKFPSYQRLFEIATNHVILKSELTGQFSADRNKIFRALKAGNFYFSFDILGNPKGFNFLAKTKDRDFLMGSTLPLTNDLSLHFSLPAKPQHPFEFRLFRNGQIVEIFRNTSGSFKITEPGVYRLDVRVRPPWPFPDQSRWVHWIFSNPIRVVDPLQK